MIAFNLDSIEKAQKLSLICCKFSEDIDVLYGRQIIDGKSILGVTSLIGHVVGIEINTDDDQVKQEFIKDLAKA